MEQESLECSYCKSKDTWLNMFRCRECEATFCSEHRLTFDHSCRAISTPISSSSSSSSSSSVGVKATFKAVENRFAEGSENAGSQTFHYQVKTTPKEEPIQHDASFARIDNLLATWKNDSLGEKQRSMALKTAQMLMKSKAWGDVEDVNTKDPSNRIYFMVEFTLTGAKRIVYFAKKSRVGDVLHKLGRKFTSFVFGTATIPPDKSVVCSSDSFSWQDDNWDRSGFLCNCIKEFETLKISTVSTVDAAACQSVIEQKRNASGSVFQKVSDISAHTYGKGNRVFYEANVDVARKEATIIGVHYDDYPNVYYTILLDDGVEKQTIASRLMPLDESTEEISCAAANVHPSNATTMAVENSMFWKVEISHGLRGKYIIEVDPDWSIAEMKMKVAEVTGVPLASQKLMCKGSMLKSDAAKIIDTKITNQCKISLIGNAATNTRGK